MTFTNVEIEILHILHKEKKSLIRTIWTSLSDAPHRILVEKKLDHLLVVGAVKKTSDVFYSLTRFGEILIGKNQSNEKLTALLLSKGIELPLSIKKTPSSPVKTKKIVRNIPDVTMKKTDNHWAVLKNTDAVNQNEVSLLNKRSTVINYQNQLSCEDELLTVEAKKEISDRHNSGDSGSKSGVTVTKNSIVNNPVCKTKKVDESIENDFSKSKGERVTMVSVGMVMKYWKGSIFDGMHSSLFLTDPEEMLISLFYESGKQSLENIKKAMMGQYISESELLILIEGLVFRGFVEHQKGSYDLMPSAFKELGLGTSDPLFSFACPPRFDRDLRVLIDIVHRMPRRRAVIKNILKTNFISSAEFNAACIKKMLIKLFEMGVMVKKSDNLYYLRSTEEILVDLNKPTSNPSVDAEQGKGENTKAEKPKKIERNKECKKIKVIKKEACAVGKNEEKANSLKDGVVLVKGVDDVEDVTVVGALPPSGGKKGIRFIDALAQVDNMAESLNKPVLEEVKDIDDKINVLLKMAGAISGNGSLNEVLVSISKDLEKVKEFQKA